MPARLGCAELHPYVARTLLALGRRSARRNGIGLPCPSCREGHHERGHESGLRDGRGPHHLVQRVPGFRSRPPLVGSRRTTRARLPRTPGNAGSPNSHSTVVVLLSPARGPPVEKFSTPASTGVDGGASTQGVPESYNASALPAGGLLLGLEADRALNCLGRSLPSGGLVFSRASCSAHVGGATTRASLAHRRVWRHSRLRGTGTTK